MIEFATIILLLILIVISYITYKIGQGTGRTKTNKEWEEKLPLERKDAIMRSRAILGGHFSEQLAPYLPNFPHSPTECKFLGKPIDLLVFKGSDEKAITEVVFVEIKSGKSTLTTQEKTLKNAIKEKKVRWEEYRIPEELTKKATLDEELLE